MKHYLIIAIDGSDIVSYHLLDEVAMERAEKLSYEESDGDDYWFFVSSSRRKGMKTFRNFNQLQSYMLNNDIHQFDGEFGAIAY